jgi:nitric oxide reductase NorE protein
VTDPNPGDACTTSIGPGMAAVDSGGAERGKSRSVPRHLPGEAGVWVFIFGDLVVFSLFFILVMIEIGQEPEVYRESQGSLNQAFGLVNTLLMLSSSWCVALGLLAARKRRAAVASALYGCAVLCGLGFGVVKFFEWRSAFAAGHTVSTNNFFMYYFVFTGIHFMHVLIGMAVVAAMAIYTSRTNLGDRQLRMLESGSCFWHVVDVLWIILFALFYLIRA